MIKTILFDFSRVLLNAKDSNYTDSLNLLYKQIYKQPAFNFLDHFELNKKLLDFIVGLKDKYKLYIFTTGTIQNDIHLKSFIDHIFTKIFTVEEVGFPKDNEKAYQFIANTISLKPEEILFIDDLEKNIQAANLAGLKTIHFTSTEQAIKSLRSTL